LKLIEYRQWFSPIMKFLVEGFVAQIRQAMERAVEDDSEVRERLIVFPIKHLFFVRLFPMKVSFFILTQLWQLPAYV
jgi:hypothetical protein